MPILHRVTSASLLRGDVGSRTVLRGRRWRLAWGIAAGLGVRRAERRVCGRREVSTQPSECESRTRYFFLCTRSKSFKDSHRLSARLSRPVARGELSVPPPACPHRFRIRRPGGASEGGPRFTVTPYQAPRTTASPGSTAGLWVVACQRKFASYDIYHIAHTNTIYK